MSELSLGEARCLAEVFGKIEDRKVMLLTCFEPPATKYDTMKILESDEIAYPRSSLYPDVDGLRDAGFLEVVERRRFTRGALDTPKLVYGISIKGRMALAIHCYVLLSDPKTPAKKKTRARNYLQRFKSLPEWPVFIDFLKWHKERGIDLSHARIDMLYLQLTFMMASIKHPEHISDPSLRQQAERARKAVKQSQRAYLGVLRDLSRSSKQGT